MRRNGYEALVIAGVLGGAATVSFYGCSSSSSGGAGPAGDDSGVDGTSSSSSSSSSSGGSSSGGSSSGGSSSGGSSGSSGGSSSGGSSGGEAGPPANTLISDQYNNRVLEVGPDGGIVWVFGNGSATPGPNSVVGPNDSERLPNGQTLIAGTGVPGGSADTACDAGAGCADNRILIIGTDGGIAWQYGASTLNTPVAAVMIPNGDILITDQANNRIVEVNPADSGVAWTYGPDAGAGSLNAPNSAQRLPSGNTVIADENNGRVIEVAADGGLVWNYSTVPDAGALSEVAFASRLSNGNTLISDSGNNRIVEVDAAGKLVWAYYTASRSLSATAPVVDGGNTSPAPTRALRLTTGNTLISDQNNNQVLEVAPDGGIVWSYGVLNVAGPGAGMLNGPYDAKRIGDYTGLPTPP